MNDFPFIHWRVNFQGCKRAFTFDLVHQGLFIRKRRDRIIVIEYPFIFYILYKKLYIQHPRITPLWCSNARVAEHREARTYEEGEKIAGLKQSRMFRCYADMFSPGNVSWRQRRDGKPPSAIRYKGQGTLNMHRNGVTENGRSNRESSGKIFTPGDS